MNYAGDVVSLRVWCCERPLYVRERRVGSCEFLWRVYSVMPPPPLLKGAKEVKRREGGGWAVQI